MAIALLTSFFGCLLSARASALAAPTLATASVTKPTNPDVQWYVVNWKDNSAGEVGFQIRARLGRTGPFVAVANADPDSESWAFAISHQKDGAVLQYQVLAFGGTQAKPAGFSAPSNNAEVTVPADKFDAPSGFTATAKDGGEIEIKWTDNSTTEEGFAVELKDEGATEFRYLGNAQFNSTSVTITGFDKPGQLEEFRIRAIRGTTPAVGAVDPEHATAYAATASTKVLNLITSSSEVSSYWGEELAPFTVLTTHPDLLTSMTVTDLPPGLAFDPITKKITGIPTAIGTSTAKVTASFSSLSEVIHGEIAFAILAPVVTSRAFEPATVGSPFSLELETTSAPQRTTLTLTPPLPEGLSYNATTSILSGTPAKSGVYVIPVSATFTGYAPTVASTLTLRVRPPAGAPENIPNADLNLSIPQGGPCTVNLLNFFHDPDAGSAVRLQTNLTGNNTVDVLLYPDSTPETVANFLKYVDAGDYDSTVFHRSMAGFIIQGGGFFPTATPNQFFSVPPRNSPVNEPGISNLRGTVAMAKIGGLPNSATTNFFFNLANNSANLDDQNGGFTAFGRVSASSLATMDALAAKPTKSYSVSIDGAAAQSYTDWPVNAASAPASMDNTKMLAIQSARRIPVLSFALPYDPSSDALSASLSGDALSLTGLKPGTKDIEVKITDLDGNEITRTLHVTVGQTTQYSENGQSGDAPVFEFESGTGASLAPSNSGNETAYRWLKDGKVVPGAASATLDFPATKLADAGVYKRIATTAGGEVSSTLLVGVVEFSRQTLLAKAGAKVVLSAKVGGPGFSISWQKDSAPLSDITGKIAGASTPQLTISSFAAADSGSYQCILHAPGGAAGLRIPRSVTTVVGGPVVKNSYLAPLVVRQQSSFGISWDTAAGILPVKFTITGLPPGLTYNPVTGAISGRPTAAGSYSLSVTGTNAFGKGEKTTIPLVVKPLPAGSLGKFSAFVPKDQNLNADLGGFVTVTTAADGTYSGELVLGLNKYKISGELTTGPGVVPHFALSFGLPAELNVSIAGNALTGTIGSLALGTRNLSLSPLVVSQLASSLNSGWDTAVGMAPVKFEISGLPKGMTFDPATGFISGTPTVSGTFSIKIVAVSASGSREERTIPLVVSALPSGSVGTFVALVARDATLNSGLGGLLTVTPTVSGAYTGKIVLGTESCAFSGVLSSGNATSPHFSKTITRKDASQVSMDVTLNANVLTATLLSGNATSNVSGAKTIAPPAAMLGRFNTRFSIPDADTNAGKIDTVPQGHGFAALTTGSDGAIIIIGKLADGTNLLASSSFGSGGKIPMHVIFPSKKDVLLGTAIVTQASGGANPALSGAVEWLVAPGTKERPVFPQSFGPQTLDWKGAKYLPPAAGTIVLGLAAAADNAALSFFEANLLTESVDPDVTLSITTKNAAVFPATNPATVTMKIDPLKGTFTGEFRLSALRKSPFQGVLITGSGGFGYFILPQLPPSLRTPALSGAVKLAAP